MIDKELLTYFLKLGLSTRKIAELMGESKSNIQYTVRKYGLTDLYCHKKREPIAFNKIDTPEKAYITGFILGDGCIINNGIVSITVALRDREILEFITKELNAEISDSYKFDRDKRIFPHSSTTRVIRDITKFIAGPLKVDRHYPIVPYQLEHYLLLGFFDADGCITWGRRKDRNRIWQKVQFKSAYKILYGVQQVLLKRLNIATIIHPVKDENCYELCFSNKRDVLIFLSFIYQDPNFIILKRKYQKACALRLELEENGETLAFPGQYRAEPTE